MIVIQGHFFFLLCKDLKIFFLATHYYSHEEFKVFHGSLTALGKKVVLLP